MATRVAVAGSVAACSGWSMETQCAPSVPDLQRLRDLLGAYQAMLDAPLAAHRAKRFFRWSWASSLRRFAIEQVRQSLATLERRYSAHASLADHLDQRAVEGRERVAQFAASLPAKPSRLRMVLRVVAVLVLGRILLALAPNLLWAPLARLNWRMRPRQRLT